MSRSGVPDGDSARTRHTPINNSGFASFFRNVLRSSLSKGNRIAVSHNLQASSENLADPHGAQSDVPKASPQTEIHMGDPESPAQSTKSVRDHGPSSESDNGIVEAGKGDKQTPDTGSIHTNAHLDTLPIPRKVLDAEYILSQAPRLVAESATLADRLNDLREVFPILRSNRITNISLLWHSMGHIVEAAGMNQVSKHAPLKQQTVPEDNDQYLTARIHVLEFIAALAEGKQKHDDLGPDIKTTRAGMLDAIMNADGWDEVVLAVQCASWASDSARRFQCDSKEWFECAKEWTIQAISRCYKADETKEPFQTIPDDARVALTKCLFLLSDIVREEYPVISQDAVSDIIFDLCSQATSLRLIDDNDSDSTEALWLWSEAEHIYGVLNLLHTVICYGAIFQKALDPGIILLCTSVMIDSCCTLAKDTAFILFTSCYMRDTLLSMNCILRGGGIEHGSLPLYGLPGMTVFQGTLLGVVYFITQVMSTVPTGFQFELCISNCLPVLREAVKYKSSDVLNLVFPYLYNIIDDERSKDLSPEDWQLVIGILEETVDCRIDNDDGFEYTYGVEYLDHQSEDTGEHDEKGEHYDYPENQADIDHEASIDDTGPAVSGPNWYDDVLTCLTVFFEKSGSQPPNSLMILLYNLRAVLTDELATHMLQLIDAQGSLRPGSIDWIEKLKSIVSLYYSSSDRSIQLRQLTIGMCAKSMKEAVDTHFFNTECSSLALSVLDKFSEETDIKIVDSILDILRCILKYSENDMKFKALKCTINVSREPSYIRPKPLLPHSVPSGMSSIGSISSTSQMSTTSTIQSSSTDQTAEIASDEDLRDESLYSSYARAVKTVECLTEIFEWRVAVVADSQDSDDSQDDMSTSTSAFTIELANTLFTIMESDKTFPTVQYKIISLFLRLHADSNLMLYVLRTDRDTVIYQRVSFNENARLRITSDSYNSTEESEAVYKHQPLQFPIQRYVRLLPCLFENVTDHIVYCILCQGLTLQFGNTYLFSQCLGDVQSFIVYLIKFIKRTSLSQDSRVRVSEEDNMNVSTNTYGLLITMVHYKDQLKREQQDALITAFRDGLVVTSTKATTPKICFHALTVSMLELPGATMRQLTSILQQLVKIYSAAQLSVHLLEFVSALSREQHLYANFRPDEYRLIFSVAINYIRFHNNQRRRENASAPISSTSTATTAISSSATSTPNQFVGSLPKGTENASLSTDPRRLSIGSNSSKQPLDNVALSQYVFVMAYQLIDIFYFSLAQNFKEQTVDSLIQGLLLANYDRESLDETNEVCLDMILRSYNRSSKEIQEKPDTVTIEDLGSIEERSWIQHNGIVTIRAQKDGPLAQIIIRSPSESTSRIVDLPAEVSKKYKEYTESSEQASQDNATSPSRSPTTDTPPSDLGPQQAGQSLYSFTHQATESHIVPHTAASSGNISRNGNHLHVSASGRTRGSVRNRRLHSMGGPGMNTSSADSEVLPPDTVSRLLRGELVQIQGSTSRGAKVPIRFGKSPSVAQELITAYPGLQNIDFPELLPTQVESVARGMRLFDSKSMIDTHKASVIYVGPGQTSEREILLNRQGSQAYWAFLHGLGDITRLGDMQGYSAGLDTSGHDQDGRYTIKWRDLISQFVFHVSTFIPACEDEGELIVRKKAHIGNDYVHIIFNESGNDFAFDTIPSEFNYVQIIVSPVDGRVPSHEAESSWLHSDPKSAETRYLQLYKVKTQVRPGIPFIGPAKEPKLLTLTALPAFVRTIAIHAATLSQVYSECKKNNGVGEFVSHWRARLQSIKRIRSAAQRASKVAQPQSSTSSPSPQAQQMPTSSGKSPLDSPDPNSNSLPETESPLDIPNATACQVLAHLSQELESLRLLKK